MTGLAGRLDDRAQRALERRHAVFDKWASRLAPALAALLSRAGREIATNRDKVAQAGQRLDAAPRKRLADLQRRLEQLDRTRLTLGHAETLRRGFAIVRGDGQVVTRLAEAERATSLEVEFADGRMTLGARPPRKSKPAVGPDQGSLF